ncbi:hypothetical protein ACLKA7_005211 [Drosophila subpalustris]
MQEVATQGVSSDSRPLEVSDDPLPELDASNGTNGTNPPDRSLFRGGNPRRRGRPYRSVNTRREEPVSIDYSVIQNMIEQTVTRLLTSLAVSSNPMASVQQSPSAQTSSASRTSVPPSKVAQIMQKWNIQFDGSAEGLSVDEFMYRVKVLTDETLDGDLSALCKHIHILFVGRARDWYWRYHKKVDRITWSEFCLALRQQYRDYKSEFASKEEIRSRKQKLGESFANFYESVVSLIDKSSVRIEEEELIEILKNNLLPEARHKLLYQPVHSVGQLRKLVQMHENLVTEISSCAGGVPKPRQPVQRRQVFAVEELDAEDDLGVYINSKQEIAAIRHSTVTCWNCDVQGHV